MAKISKKRIPVQEEEYRDSFPDDLYILPVKVRPIFPGIITPLIVPVGLFTDMVEEANKKDGFIGLTLLKEDESDLDVKDNIYEVGVIARILKKINLPDGGINILVNTQQRFRIQKVITETPYLHVKVRYLSEILKGSKNNLKALMRTLMILTRELAQNNPLFTEEMKLTLVNMEEPSRMADFVASILNLEKEEYQSILEMDDIIQKIEEVILYLKKEIELISLQRKINDQINDKLDKQQRNFFLREQLKVIQGELGVHEDRPEKKYNDLLERLIHLKLDEQVISEVAREIEKLNYADPNSGDYNVIRNYLDIINSLPWENSPDRKIDLKFAEKILNRDHYKLDDVKQRILEYLAVKKLNPENHGPILCLVGPPGVGKTSIARSIAESLGKKFFRFSLGGVRDEAEIKGHRRTYIGAMPGKIITALRHLKEKDPVILLDEIDKLSIGIQGDPASALLEVLDPEQNKHFRDHYLDLPFDLSRVLFVATANTMDSIPGVLADRMDVIRLTGYITEEKVEIFKRFLWKKVMEKTGIKDKRIQLDKPAILELVESYSRESGVRSLERMTDKIVRKVAYKQVRGLKFEKTIKKEHLEEYLGVPVFPNDRMTKPTQPGMAVGLAWTNYGGATLLIETLFIRSKNGGIFLTGKLGEVMGESANIALNHIKYLIGDGNYFDERKVHIHVPDGATPKDGPSAGITMATAILSLIIGRIVPAGFGMTGELTLTGEVLPIGGLREKLVAARRAGLNRIIFPRDNEPNLKEVPSYIKKGLRFYPVSRFSEVIEILFKKIDLSKEIQKTKQ